MARIAGLRRHLTTAPQLVARKLSAINECMDDVRLQHGEKLVWFFRHGESAANVAKAEAAEADQTRNDGRATAMYKVDPRLADAPLTERGLEQARQGAATIAAWRVQPELIVCSPLTRALQTAALLYESALLRGTPLVVRPELREFFGHLIEARGRPVEQLLADARLRALPSWPVLEAALAPEATRAWRQAWDTRLADGAGWREHADDGARCVAFKRWLSEQRQTRVATVSHWGTVNNMANREPCIEARGLEREAPPPAWVKAGGWSSRSWPPAVHLLQMPNAGHVAMVFSSESDS